MVLSEIATDGAAGVAGVDRGVHRRGGVLATALLVVLLVESVVRLGAGRLPEPQRWSTPETQYKVAQIRDLGSAQTVAVGSSVVDVALDPSRLGDGAYNAALGAATIGMVAEFTRAVVVPELDPDVVVVGVTSRELNANAAGQSAIEDAFFAAPGARHVLGGESLLQRAERAIAEVSYLVRYRSVLRDPEAWIDPKPAWDGALTRDDGLYLGFLHEDYHGGPGVLQGLRDGALHDFAVGADEVETLRALLTDLRLEGRRVLLVAAPVTQDYVEMHPRGATDHAAFLAAVRRIAEQSGVDFVDAGVWDEALMADPLHTNGRGADRFSGLVARALA